MQTKQAVKKTSVKAIESPQKAGNKRSGVSVRRGTGKRSKGHSAASPGTSRVRHLPIFGLDVLPERFWNKVRVIEETNCWEWTASKNKDGYGYFYWERKTPNAHRVAFLVFKGRLPKKGNHIDHFKFPGNCIGPSCVNPSHLRETTPAKNILRGTNPFAKCSQADTCVHGHPWDEENTAWIISRTTGRKARRCRACNRNQQRKWKQRNPERWVAIQKRSANRRAKRKSGAAA